MDSTIDRQQSDNGGSSQTEFADNSTDVDEILYRIKLVYDGAYHVTLMYLSEMKHKVYDLTDLDEKDWSADVTMVMESLDDFGIALDREYGQLRKLYVDRAISEIIE